MKLKINWGGVGDALLKFLRGELIKKLVLIIVGASTGFQAWIVGLAVGVLFDYVAAPILKEAARRGILIYDKVDGKIKLKKLKDARNEHDQDRYDSTIDDIIG
jgi:hypothetical protein